MTKSALDLMKTSAKDFAVKPLDHFIGGEWCSAKGQKTVELFDPSHAYAFSCVPIAGKNEVDAAVSAARMAFESGEWSKMQPAARAKVLWRIADLIEEHGDILAELESLDNGKPLTVARIADVSLAAQHFRYYAGWCGKNFGQYS